LICHGFNGAHLQGYAQLGDVHSGMRELRLGFLNTPSYFCSTFNSTMNHQKSQHTLSVLALGSIAVGAIGSALFLRYGHGPSRQAITWLLGYEGRAALEHLLVAIGMPLAAGLMFFGYWVVLHRATRLLGKWVSRLLQEPVPPLSTLPIVTAAFSTVYLLSQLVWEYGQKTHDVYGAAARGYIQPEQLVADLVGAIVAVLLAWHCMRGEKALRPIH
jgi:hypothetical protein